MRSSLGAIRTILLGLILAACAGAQAVQSISTNACLPTEPEWVKPPEDSAVLDPPAYGDYFVNADKSIWASAAWATETELEMNVAERWIKVGWFRPAGAELVVTGHRLDGESPRLEFEAPCCYPTRFQASGLYFPTAGCWKVTAKASDRELSFIVQVEP